MFIDEIFIKKFRGFEDVKFKLGKQLTAIAGQNGTQKTTVLGMLSQPFSISIDKHPLYGEKPLSGGNFKSGFDEKFKLSVKYDLPGLHEWTLAFNNPAIQTNDFTLMSYVRRDKYKRVDPKKPIRFWKKGDRTTGSGYIQLPVIYLSLSRALPIGEDDNIDLSDNIQLTEEECKFYHKWHNNILLIINDKAEVDYLESNVKNTLGVSTDNYDWRMNSAGQDNIGKILLAIISFKRLKEKHASQYHGGILAIDEIDVTLFPASQIKLLNALRIFASKYKIQIIFTTHSLSILRELDYIHKEFPEQVATVYLEKCDGKIIAVEDLSFEDIYHRLNVSLGVEVKREKIKVFLEDHEAITFFKGIVKRRYSNLEIIDCPLSCSKYIDLAQSKVPGFKFPDSLIILDGDVNGNASDMKKVRRIDNIVLLPGSKSPERLLADFLFNLSDTDYFWKSVNKNYSKQYCFRDYSFSEISNDRSKAKEWFKQQAEEWGRGCSKAMNRWIEDNGAIIDVFINNLDLVVEKFEKVL